MDKRLYAFTLDDNEYSRVVKVLKQTGKKPNMMIDKSRIAKFPGKRVSKTGNIYWETRQNRSDVSQAKRI